MGPWLVSVLSSTSLGGDGDVRGSYWIRINGFGLKLEVFICLQSKYSITCRANKALLKLFSSSFPENVQ